MYINNFTLLDSETSFVPQKAYSSPYEHFAISHTLNLWCYHVFYSLLHVRRSEWSICLMSLLLPFTLQQKYWRTIERMQHLGEMGLKNGAWLHLSGSGCHLDRNQVGQQNFRDRDRQMRTLILRKIGFLIPCVYIFSFFFFIPKHQHKTFPLKNIW